MYFSIWSACCQVERLPILIDSPKKLDHQLSSDPDKTPVSNAANSDSEPEDMNQPGETESFRMDNRFHVCVCVSHCCRSWNRGCTSLTSSKNLMNPFLFKGLGICNRWTHHYFLHTQSLLYCYCCINDTHLTALSCCEKWRETALLLLYCVCVDTENLTSAHTFVSLHRAI